MARLSLEDVRWATLHQRNGAAGWVPARLAHLLPQPEDVDAFSDLTPRRTRVTSSPPPPLSRATPRWLTPSMLSIASRSAPSAALRSRRSRG
jgi:hypothetical protein